MALENSLKMRWSRGEKVERLHPKMSNTDNCEGKKKERNCGLSVLLSYPESFLDTFTSESLCGWMSV